MTELPHSPDAEAALVGQALASPKVVAHVINSVEPRHFHDPAYRALWQEINDTFYAGDPIDPVLAAEPCRRVLAKRWSCDESRAVALVQELAAGRRGQSAESARKHAAVVKRHADRRELLDLAAQIQRQVADDDDPEVVASEASKVAMQVATNTLTTSELLTFGELGRRFIREQRRVMEARRRNIELGAYFGMSFIDDFLRGLRPGEVWFLAGAPGAGKSAVSWKAAERFSVRQLAKPAEQRVGALVASLEMPEETSSQRFAQALTGIDGGRIREGTTDDIDLQRIIDAWGNYKDLPLILNHSSTIRCSQLRAMASEAIRRHKVGLLVIDHWKYLETDRRYRERDDEDEAKARFLKQDIAKQLNMAVICLAHTVKGAREREGGKPKMEDLRGSGWISAHADWISFVHRPFKHASADDIEDGVVKRTEAQMLWEKCRFAADGTEADFHFDPSKMEIQ